MRACVRAPKLHHVLENYFSHSFRCLWVVVTSSWIEKWCSNEIKRLHVPTIFSVTWARWPSLWICLLLFQPCIEENVNVLKYTIDSWEVLVAVLCQYCCVTSLWPTNCRYWAFCACDLQYPIALLHRFPPPDRYFFSFPAHIRLSSVVRAVTRYVMYYNVTLWRIRVPIIAIETQQCALCVLLSYMSLWTI